MTNFRTKSTLRWTLYSGHRWQKLQGLSGRILDGLSLNMVEIVREK